MTERSRLIIAGSGIKFVSQLTNESVSAIKNSDIVFYLLNDPASERFVSQLAPKSRSLSNIYFSFENRKDAYSAIVSEVLEATKHNALVTFLNYGHPLFLCDITLDLIEKSKTEDIKIIKLPGISSFDCIISDLAIDVGKNGLQAYEATDFVMNDYKVNTAANLILWQVGVIGIEKVISADRMLESDIRKTMLEKLKIKLAGLYPDSHYIHFYTASLYSHTAFENNTIQISKMMNLNINRLATAYIPPI